MACDPYEIFLLLGVGRILSAQSAAAVLVCGYRFRFARGDNFLVLGQRK